MQMKLSMCVSVCVSAVVSVCVSVITADLCSHHKHCSLLVDIMESDSVQADAAELVYRTQTQHLMSNQTIISKQK